MLQLACDCLFGCMVWLYQIITAIQSVSHRRAMRNPDCCLLHDPRTIEREPMPELCNRRKQVVNPDCLEAGMCAGMCTGMSAGYHASMLRQSCCAVLRTRHKTRKTYAVRCHAAGLWTMKDTHKVLGNGVMFTLKKALKCLCCADFLPGCHSFNTLLEAHAAELVAAFSVWTFSAALEVFRSKTDEFSRRCVEVGFL